MSPTEIAAYIGAAAWIPPIVALLVRLATKPKLDLRLVNALTLSFRAYGPIVGLNAALFADRRDALVTNMTLRLQHERGEERVLRWDALQETVLGIRGLPEILSFENRQPALALKVPTSNVTLRTIWFADFDFKSKSQEAFSSLLAQSDFLKTRTEVLEQELAKSKEFAVAKDLFVENFFWRDGEYKCKLEIYENHNVRKQKNFRFLVPKTEVAFS